MLTGLAGYMHELPESRVWQIAIDPSAEAQKYPPALNITLC